MRIGKQVIGEDQIAQAALAGMLANEENTLSLGRMEKLAAQIGRQVYRLLDKDIDESDLAELPNDMLPHVVLGHAFAATATLDAIDKGLDAGDLAEEIVEAASKAMDEIDAKDADENGDDDEDDDEDDEDDEDDDDD